MRLPGISLGGLETYVLTCTHEMVENDEREFFVSVAFQRLKQGINIRPRLEKGNEMLKIYKV